MDTMEESSSCVPPGFRFHPTDEELVGYYLRKKVASQKIDLDVIRDIDLYRIEPWDLIERCRIGYEEQNEWYFFSHKDKKYPTGTRTNRATVAGFWKATGRDKAVFDKLKLIGMRKTLVFYKGRAPNGQKTDWIMHEYRLESEDNAPHPLEEGWVVCRAFKKRATGQTKNVEGWELNYFCDESSRRNLLISSSSSHKNFRCKQETGAESVENHQNFVRCDQFVHELPQLESPSLPLTGMKRPSSISLVSEINDYHHEEDNNYINSIDNKVMTTDWRDLDKFVASQLSQEERYDQLGSDARISSSSFQGIINDEDNSDLALLFLQGGREEGPKTLNGFLSSNSDCDIGICIFDK